MVEIPVYQIVIPEYKVKVFKEVSDDSPYSSWGIPIPREYEENKPDFKAASSKIIECLREHFRGKRIALRLLGSMEHADKSVDDMIGIIKELGYDRYDSERIGDRYQNIENKEIDFFALEFEVGDKDEEESVAYALESFYYHPISDRGTPIKIDLGIVYDIAQLRTIEHQYRGREGEIKRDGFVFRHPERKSDAVLAIIKIL